MQTTLVAVLIFTIASNYLDVVHCDGDMATTVKQTAQTKPSGKKPNPINPSRSPPRGRSPNAPTLAKKSQPPQQDKRKSVKA
ncbi:unnamed protein product [Schistosoma turkestanicum]|nr:unnamed protein product [Schistosoma turkestanicum]